MTYTYQLMVSEGGFNALEPPQRLKATDLEAAKEEARREFSRVWEGVAASDLSGPRPKVVVLYENGREVWRLSEAQRVQNHTGNAGAME